MSENEMLFVLVFVLLCIAAIGWGLDRLKTRVKKLEHEIWVRGQGWRKAE